MLHTVYQQLKYVAKWVWNSLNNYEHEVDFIRRLEKEYEESKKKNDSTRFFY
jgi:hypothetical protein